MILSFKDAVRFAVPGDPPTIVEVRVAPGDAQWEARVRFRRAAQPWEDLGRRFRAGAKGEALGKMVRWVRCKFPGAMPLPEGGATDPRSS